MIRIAFIGAGAVGGYFGGLMFAHYENSKEVEIYFICRESTAQNIERHGLQLETTHGNFQIHPLIYSTQKDTSIIFDFIICCTKSFDLEASLIPLTKNIGKETVIIPLLNGVDSYEKIKAIFPNTEVWDACVYIVSQLIGPGHIRETGGIQLLYFGSRDQYSAKFDMFKSMLVNAGLKAKYSENILSTIWEKFLFISSIATMTSYLDKSIGEILSNKEYKSNFHSLLLEIKQLAETKKILLPENILDAIYTKMLKLPFEATSSMHRDFKNGHQTELENLTGAVVKMANELDIKVPMYEKMYLSLKTNKQ